MKRRKFIVMTALATGAILASTFPKTKISFDEAVKDSNKRQELLDQIIFSLDTRYMNKIYYDPDGSEAKKIFNKLEKESYNDPFFFEYNRFMLTKKSVTDGLVRLFSTGIPRRKNWIAYWNTEEGAKEILHRFTKSLKIKVLSFYALTATYPHNIASQTNSKIFIYNNSFKDNIRDISPYPHKYKFKASLEGLTSTVVHELEHTKQVYSGLELDNGIKIDRSNMLQIHPLLFNKVLEEQAELVELDYVRKVMKNKETPAYVKSMDFFAYIQHQYVVNPSEYGELDKEIMEYRKKTFEPLKKEAKELFKELVKNKKTLPSR